MSLSEIRTGVTEIQGSESGPFGIFGRDYRIQSQKPEEPTSVRVIESALGIPLSDKTKPNTRSERTIHAFSAEGALAKTEPSITRPLHLISAVGYRIARATDRI